LVVQVIEGRSLQAELDALLGEVQDALEEGTAEIVVQRKAQLGSFEWELLQIDSARNNISLIVAGAESDAQTYLVRLQTSPDQADQLAEDVLIPLLNSLRAA
jgi:hypothetical protein